jgi:hypothetical protein
MLDFNGQNLSIMDVEPYSTTLALVMNPQSDGKFFHAICPVTSSQVAGLDTA